MSPKNLRPVTVHVSPEVKEALELLATREQRSASFIVRELVEKRIADFEKEVVQAS